MARFLQQLLEINEPTFSIGIRELEKATGLHGVDTRLIADITHKAHDIMRKLNLDPADSNPHEVYQALIASVKKGTFETLLFGADYVLMSMDGHVVSFNLIDVIENFHYQFSFEDRLISHGQRSLRGEIVHRYIDSAGTDEAITRHLALEAGLLTEADEEYYEELKNGEGDKNDRPLILAIGDIVTDAFIALREDQEEITKDDKGIRRISMEFGTKLPYDHVDIIQAVGNSANAAVAFARLGLRSGLMAYLGDDQAGKESLLYLQSQHVDTSTVSVEAGQKSNYHFALRYGADRTILIKYEDYSYGWQEPKTEPEWIYLSMLSKSAWGLHEDLQGYLERHPNVKLAFQPGTFHFEWGKEKLAAVYKRSYLVVMNKEEAATVTGKSLDSIKSLLEALHELGPEIVVITDGPDGAYISDGKQAWKMPNYPDPAPPLDRTGAGDAFASSIVAALAYGKSVKEAMQWAPINSMSVVQKLGAQEGLLTLDELQPYINEAPAEFAPEEYKE